MILTEEEIDDLRLQVMNEIGKDADRIWWNVCAAYEKMYGEDDATDMEQFLITMTNKTVEKALAFQLSKLSTIAPDVREKVEDILGEAGTQVAETKKLATTEYYKRIHAIYAGAILAAREEERERIANKTFDYFKKHMPDLIDALTMSGEWQRIFHNGQSLGGKK